MDGGFRHPYPKLLISLPEKTGKGTAKPGDRANFFFTEQYSYFKKGVSSTPFLLPKNFILC